MFAPTRALLKSPLTSKALWYLLSDASSFFVMFSAGLLMVPSSDLTEPGPTAKFTTGTDAERLAEVKRQSPGRFGTLVEHSMVLCFLRGGSLRAP